MPVTSVWQGPAVLKRVHDLIARRLDSAAIHLQNQIKAEISLPGTGGAVRALRRFKLMPWESVAYAELTGRKRRLYRRGRTIYGLVRSKPGEPPRKQYGHLRRSITHQTDRKELVAYVGSNLAYARFLELGTSKMLPRPYLRSTFYRELPVLKEIIVTGKVPDVINSPSWAT